VPERPKFKRKAKPEKASPLKPILKLIASESETDGGPTSRNSPRFDSKASISIQESRIGSQQLEILSHDEESTKDISRSSFVVNHLELLHGSKSSQSISLDSTYEKSSAGVSSLKSRDFGSTSNPKHLPCSPSALDSRCFSSTESNQGFFQLCLMCCQRPKNASLIHGRMGHQVWFQFQF
jgi:hypothetical protein